jgi:hypothetical protein
MQAAKFDLPPIDSGTEHSWTFGIFTSHTLTPDQI